MPTPILAVPTAPATAPQAMAEYVAIIAQDAAQRFQILAGDASRWLQDHPIVLWGGIALLVLMWWATRGRKI